jgi:hypothetical protein
MFPLIGTKFMNEADFLSLRICGIDLTLVEKLAKGER